MHDGATEHAFATSTCWAAAPFCETGSSACLLARQSCDPIEFSSKRIYAVSKLVVLRTQILEYYRQFFEAVDVADVEVQSSASGAPDGGARPISPFAFVIAEESLSHFSSSALDCTSCRLSSSSASQCRFSARRVLHLLAYISIADSARPLHISIRQLRSMMY